MNLRMVYAVKVCFRKWKILPPLDITFEILHVMPGGMKIRYLYCMNRLEIGIMSTLIRVTIKTHPFCLFWPSVQTKLPFFGY